MSSQYLVPIVKRQILSGENLPGIQFDNIPQNFTDLIIYISSRAVGTAARGTRIRSHFNGGDALFSNTAMGANGGISFGFRENPAANHPPGLVSLAGGAANCFSSTEITILNYSSSTRFKNIMGVTSRGDVTTSSSADFINVVASLWRNTSPITSILYSPENGTNFDVGTTFYIYGRKE